MDSQSHLDQKIIRLMDKAVMQKTEFRNIGYSLLDITTGVAVLGGVRFNFAERTLLEDKIAMIIPTDFQAIPPEKFFKPESKPDLLLTDANGALQITIAHTQKKVINDAEVAAHKNEVRQILRSLNSSIEWLDDGVKDLPGRQLLFFDFMTPMLGATVYNLTFFVELNQRVLTGNFICTNQRIKAWKPVFHQMLDSIKVVAPETEPVTPGHPDYSEYSFQEGMYAIYRGQEYRLYKVEAGQYRLISSNPQDLEDGFVKKDGVYHKTVDGAAISAAYQLKLTIFYGGYKFRQKMQAQNRVLLFTEDSRLAQELQFEPDAPGEYFKWVAKDEIENVEETRLPVAGFVMPETLAEE